MSTPLTVPEMPAESGAYLWLYTDVVAGDLTAVCIFLVGSVFSPRYAGRRGRHARPLDHCAVNCALYRGGRRIAWAFTEYPGVVQASPQRLVIGGSTLVYDDDGTLILAVVERTAPWGRPVRIHMELTPRCTPAAAVPLDADGTHRWEPRIVRATARVELPDLGIRREGIGYHDLNRGDAALGDGIPGWWWSRIHTGDRTLVRYRAHGRPRVVELAARVGAAPTLGSAPARDKAFHHSPWGLALPHDIGAGGVAVRAQHLLESSPFYARQESHVGQLHALAESADFRRFRSPLVRWMAYFRMRTERAA